MAERLILVIFLVLQGVSFYLELSSNFLKSYRAEQKFEFALQTNLKNYLVRLEENPPALKLVSLEISANNTATIGLPGCAFSPESLTQLARGLKKPVASNLTTWELLSALAIVRRFLSPTEIFYYATPDERHQQEWKLLWQNPLSKLNPTEMSFLFEILNATDEPGLALRFGRLLRRRLPAFDAIAFGNAAPQQDNSSSLLIYKDNLHVAKRILLSLNRAMALNLKNHVAYNPNRGVDFALVLGASAKRLAPNFKYFDLLGVSE